MFVGYVLHRTYVQRYIPIIRDMLHEFLTENRALLIDRCRALVARRSAPKNSDCELAHGIPIFLDQLIKTLSIEERGGNQISEIAEMAALHGHDLFDQGFTIEQVVRDYGDVGQSITHLAFETETPITVAEFRTLNRCLDIAIAGAVTEFARYGAASSETSFRELNLRFGSVAHELRNYLHTVALVIKAIKSGNVGISGATASVLDRSLVGMRNLIDRSLTEVRITAMLPPRPKPIRLAMFLSELETSASLDAQARECRFVVSPVGSDVWIHADPEMLSSALSNLLQNGFQLTKAHTEVRLHTHIVGTRVLIEVEDHCGGLPAGAAGLDLCRRNIEANNGILRVHDTPGSGCGFTIDLPHHLAA